MKMLMCAVMDTAVNAFQPPFCARAPGEATRMFLDACRDPDRTGIRHPNDLVLYHIGWYDDQSGMVSPVSPPELMVTGRSLAEV